MSNSITLQSITIKITKYIKAKELAKLAGVCEPRISNLKTGAPESGKLKLAKKMKIALDKMITELQETQENLDNLIDIADKNKQEINNMMK